MHSVRNHTTFPKKKYVCMGTHNPENTKDHMRFDVLTVRVLNHADSYPRVRTCTYVAFTISWLPRGVKSLRDLYAIS